jgi:HPt (histidine-containing phosphotransfer) domain-containing protein
LSFRPHRKRVESAVMASEMSAPSSDSPLLDVEHLRRQTAGDRALERDLLALFATQCARLRLLIREGELPVERADAAHTLKGSARAIGAVRLATLADRLEAALRSGDADVMGLMDRLDEAIAATRQALSERERAIAA